MLKDILKYLLMIAILTCSIFETEIEIYVK